MRKVICLKCGDEVRQNGDKIECPSCGLNFQMRCPQCFATCNVSNGRANVCNCGWTIR